jgi:hypothetical protein
MKYAFVSMPMAGKSWYDVELMRKNILDKNGWEDVYELCDCKPHPDICNEVENLGLSLYAMGKADVIYFARGWQSARGCRVEHKVCQSYKLMKKVVYEDD